MASSSKRIGEFDLALILASVSKNPDVLSSNINLNKLTKAINQFFAPEAINAGSTGTNSTGPGA